MVRGVADLAAGRQPPAHFQRNHPDRSQLAGFARCLLRTSRTIFALGGDTVRRSPKMVRDVRRSRLEREPRNLKVPDSPHTTCKCRMNQKPKSRMQKPYVDHPQAMARTFNKTSVPQLRTASPNRRCSQRDLEIHTSHWSEARPR